MQGFDHINRDTLQRLLDNTPRTKDNQQLIQSLQGLLSAKRIQPVPYSYNAVFWTTGAANNIASGVTAPVVNVNIQADADFLVMNQTYDANTANAARTQTTAVVPNALVLLTDTGSSSQLMDVATPIPSIFGTGQLPYVLPEPRLLLAKSTLQVQVANIDAAAGYNIRLTFNGVKLYKYN